MVQHTRPASIDATLTYQFDLGREKLVPMRELPALIESITGDRPHLNSVRRLARESQHRIALPTVMIGGRRYSSRPAVLWWISSTNRVSGSPGSISGDLSVTPSERATLERAGILPAEAQR